MLVEADTFFHKETGMKILAVDLSKFESVGCEYNATSDKGD